MNRNAIVYAHGRPLPTPGGERESEPAGDCSQARRQRHEPDAAPTWSEAERLAFLSRAQRVDERTRNV